MSFLDLDSGLKRLPLLLGALLCLGTHDTTTPLLSRLLGLLDVAILDGRDELRQLVLVLRANLGESEDSSGLPLISILATTIRNLLTFL